MSNPLCLARRRWKETCFRHSAKCSPCFFRTLPIRLHNPYYSSTVQVHRIPSRLLSSLTRPQSTGRSTQTRTVVTTPAQLSKRIQDQQSTAVLKQSLKYPIQSYICWCLVAHTTTTLYSTSTVQRWTQKCKHVVILDNTEGSRAITLPCARQVGRREKEK
ncbi:unnamed protein product [Tuber melanosporum]|uniref:(Perigord truffle) hypothetical protein n=1 Tax=Tuber melanosporum (strain Mel28) TaxID=656061 RepID=D5GA16_TUBMM|nr:uncharacterized protein GSTUM_00003497001 [Tuber melanosporum]CAZ81359.1 unnamed protein product [Tuber melanosporum]